MVTKKIVNRAALIATIVIGIAAPTVSQALSCGISNAREQIDGYLEAGKSPKIVIGFPLGKEIEDEHSVIDMERLLEKNPHRGSTTAHYEIFGIVIGTKKPRKIEVTIANHCVSQWCGVLPRRYMPKTFILQEEDGQLEGAVGPCGGNVFPIPTPKQKAALEHCLSEGKCDPADRSLDELQSIYR